MDKVKSISLDLQRKEDETSDLKEKLADSKKKVQQVQKEVQFTLGIPTRSKKLLPTHL